MHRILWFSLALAALATLAEDPAAPTPLPKVLIIGDSISNGYTPFVQQMLTGKAEVVHSPGNAQDTRKGLAELDAWLEGQEFELIHFNWGLWDLRRDPPNEDDAAVSSWSAVPVRVPLEEYKQNLEQLVRRLEQTGAKLLWASTSRVPHGGSRRIAREEVTYNAAAADIMAKHSIPINDIHRLTRSFPASHSTAPGNVHFTDAAYEEIAVQVTAEISAALTKGASQDR